MRRDWKVKQKSTERAPICDATGETGRNRKGGEGGYDEISLNTSMPPTFLASTCHVVLSESFTHEQEGRGRRVR